MSTLAIEGGHRLAGSVDVEGNKNSALPLLAACLLTTEECVLTNVPRISDVEVMARLLIDLGATVEGIGTTTLRVRCLEVSKDEPDGAMVGRLRGSVLLFGPLLARRGRARLRMSIASHAAAVGAATSSAANSHQEPWLCRSQSHPSTKPAARVKVYRAREPRMKANMRSLQLVTW